MIAPDTSPDYAQRATRSAFLYTRLFNIPFWAILNMLTMILYKEMHISPLQIAIFIALKPLSALFAPYWSSSLHQRHDRLVPNLVWANVLRYLPFLFFPLIDSPWLIIFSYGFYMMFARGVMPAWMEIFKQNIQGMARERVLAYGSALDYLGPALLPLGIGMVLDDYHFSWRWMFFGAALIGLSSTFILTKIPSTIFKINEKEPISIGNEVLKPWQQSWDLIKKRPDFRNYLVGFMLGGSGLILMHSTLTMFFVDVLHLSYTEMGLAIAFCKGIGFVATSPLWLKLFRKIDIYLFSGLVTILCVLFPFFLIGAEYHLIFLYFAYLLYGFMQAGSELSWHMSGPVFSKDQASSVFSQTNVVTIGMRGCVVPFIGSFLYTISNSTVVLFCGAMLCLIATIRLIHASKEFKVLSESSV